MAIARFVRSIAGHPLGFVHRFLRSPRGTAAVEFAFIAPVLLTLYFVTMEVSQGIEANKKVGRVASMVADLVTQQQETNEDAVDAIMRIGEAVLQPYNRTRPVITVTAIEVTNAATPQVRVVWSRKLENNVFSDAYTKGTVISTLPEKLKVKGTFLIRVETKLNYKPVIVWTAEGKSSLGLASAFDKLSMKELYYLRPRMSGTIPCTDC